MFSAHASKELVDFTQLSGQNQLSSIELHPVLKNELPSPYSFLLTQPLITPELEKFYGGISSIQILHAQRNLKADTYSRMVIMNIVSKDDEVHQALPSEKIAVELALITINLKQLSNDLMHDIFNTSVPFGKLLLQYDIKVYSRGFKYYSLICTTQLAQLIRCPLNKTIYARKNYLYRKDTNEWLAHVLEILPGHII